MKKKIAFLLLIPIITGFYLHKYYVALTEIEYNAKSKSVQLIMNVFMDDIELVINKDYNVDINLDSAQEDPNVDNYFFTYLQEHLQIKVNGVAKNFDYVGKEYEGNIVFFYLEIQNIEAVNSIEVVNDMLIKYFPKQQNLIKVKVKRKRKSLFLDRSNYKGLLKF